LLSPQPSPPPSPPSQPQAFASGCTGEEDLVKNRSLAKILVDGNRRLSEKDLDWKDWYMLGELMSPYAPYYESRFCKVDGKTLDFIACFKKYRECAEESERETARYEKVVRSLEEAARKGKTRRRKAAVGAAFGAALGVAGAALTATGIGGIAGVPMMGIGFSHATGLTPMVGAKRGMERGAWIDKERKARLDKERKARLDKERKVRLDKERKVRLDKLRCSKKSKNFRGYPQPVHNDPLV